MVGDVDPYMKFAIYRVMNHLGIRVGHLNCMLSFLRKLMMGDVRKL